ncbi:MAG: hypothetical protein GF383_05480 [Candidatus Lokiarchaeota archaeon]|nr:hypothetical protein [Candidatus Lokiarchaeota archaeon]
MPRAPFSFLALKQAPARKNQLNLTMLCSPELARDEEGFSPTKSHTLCCNQKI